MLNSKIHFLALALVLAQARANPTILGKWEAVDPSDNITRFLEFRRDGRFFESLGASGNAAYRLDGDRILIEDSKRPTGPPGILELRIEGDWLVMKSDDGVMRFPRIGRRPKDALPLVGKWGLKIPFPNRPTAP